jgi:hypothetical protein
VVFAHLNVSEATLLRWLNGKGRQPFLDISGARSDNSTVFGPAVDRYGAWYGNYHSAAARRAGSAQALAQAKETMKIATLVYDLSGATVFVYALLDGGLVAVRRLAARQRAKSEE